MYISRKYLLLVLVLEMKEIHKPYICLIYGKLYQHIFRYCLLVNINGYHHIIWKRVSSYALLCCGIVENICTLVRGEEGPRVPIPSLQTIKCSFLNFSILEGYWLCIGVVLTTLVNEMVPEWAQESDHNINSAYRAYLLVSSYLLSNTSQRIVCINDLTWTSSTCVIIPLSYIFFKDFKDTFHGLAQCDGTKVRGFPNGDLTTTKLLSTS